MSIVRFATICDRCGKRSEEYGSWPSCRCCVDDVCPACSRPELTDDETGRTTCLICYVEERSIGEGAEVSQ